MVGKRVGRLVVTARAGTSEKGERLWILKCDCGNEKKLPTYRIVRGDTKSCGCLQKEITPIANLKHGLYGKPTYRTWDGIVDRCENPNANGYENYGGRGIKVCSGIRKNAGKIVEKIGPKPPKLSIDRINNEGNYSCGDCEDCVAFGWPLNIRWATASQQLRNTRSTRFITIGGITKCLIQWAEDTGLTRLKIAQRIKRGWPESRWLEGALK